MNPVIFFPNSLMNVFKKFSRVFHVNSRTNFSHSTVGCLAHQVVWQCIVEDPELFFRTMYENITKTDKQVPFESLQSSHVTTRI